MGTCELFRGSGIRFPAVVLGIVLTAFSAASPVVGQDRVDLIPTGPSAVVRALSPFADPSDSSIVAQLLEKQSIALGFPVTDYDRVLVGRLWRRAGEPELALAILSKIPAPSDAGDLAAYETARVMFEAGRDAAGGGAYWRACGSSDSRVRAEIAWDLLPVTTPEEREAWTQLAPGEATCEWLRDFWDERALRMAAPREERIGVHFRRLAEAHGRFRLKRPRALHGMSDAYGRPAGLAVDDRGLLLIRMGAPDEELACPEEVSPDGLRNLIGRCWVYWRPAGYRVFYLSTRDRFQGEWPFGDYRIQENLSQQAEPGTHLFQKYVMNADLPEATKRRFVRRGPVFRNAKLEQLRLDGIVTRVVDSQSVDNLSGDLDQAEFLALRREVRDATRAFTAEVLERIPDAPDIESTANLRFETLRFLNPSSGTWQIWLVGSVRAGDLTPSSDKPDGTLDAAGRFATLRPGGLEAGELGPVSVSASSVPEAAGLGLRGVVSALPGTLPLTVVIEDLNAPGTGAWIQDTVNVPAIGGLPQLSDIAVAQAEGGSWTRDGVTYLQVSPAHVTNPDGSIHTYFEVYGVRPGTAYDVELRLTETDAAERIWRLKPGDLGFRLEFTAEMAGDIGRHHLRLDLGDTEPGEYVLAVRIQDEDSGAYSLPSVTDVFVAER